MKRSPIKVRSAPASEGGARSQLASAFCQALDEAIGATRRHPSAHQLVAYVKGGLPQAQCHAVQGHLTICSEVCVPIVLDLAAGYGDRWMSEAIAPLYAGGEGLASARLPRASSARGALTEHSDTSQTIRRWIEAAAMVSYRRQAISWSALDLSANRRIGTSRPRRD